jgi:type III pantothenate kinase
MLLLIDAGNTRIKWATAPLPAGAVAVPPLAWTASGAGSHAELPQLAAAWQASGARRVQVSNVAGTALRNALEASLAAALPGAEVNWFSSSTQAGGLKNAYRNPAQLGCDRLAAAIGAHALFPAQDLVVATCGTATTIDAVSADGTFLGGMILPGLQLMAQSLARNTAQLPQIAGYAAGNVSERQIFADNTDQAIASGCIQAQVGAIAQAVEGMRQLSQAPVTCLLSGGAAPVLQSALVQPHHLVENLVLAGLYVVQAKADATT